MQNTSSACVYKTRPSANLSCYYITVFLDYFGTNLQWKQILKFFKNYKYFSKSMQMSTTLYNLHIYQLNILLIKTDFVAFQCK